MRVKDFDSRTAPRVELACDAELELPDRHRDPVHVELIAGRCSYSVGGRIAEGPRWWRGKVQWDEDAPVVPDGVEIWLHLEDGACGVAVIEPAPASPAGVKVIRGVGAPPFEVP